MIDELELLKKDWQKKEGQHPKLSYDEIYSMLWKKSSSIVKWILIISILELILPNLVYLSPSIREDIFIKGAEDFNTYYLVIMAIYYVVVIYFISLFYKRYKEISVLENAKNLMAQIIRVRTTVKYYIIFCLSMSLVFVAYYALGIYFNDEVLLSIEGIPEKVKEVPLEKIRAAALWILIIGGIVITAVAACIYFLLYGLLLRKLKKNYNELQQLDL
jgi:hypothetical protein